MEQLNLSLTQKFEIERFGRLIDETTDINDLRKISKQLLQAWYSQKAATEWVMRENLSNPPSNFSINQE